MRDIGVERNTVSTSKVEDAALDPGDPIGAAAFAHEGALGTPRFIPPRLAKLSRHREVRRLVAFLGAGGVSALVTITVTAVLTDLEHVRFLWAAIAGTELGVLVSFAINDRMAFRDLEGHARPLPARLMRFHITYAFGQTLILLLSLVLHDIAHWRSIFAQGLPIGLVTVVNFLMHRFWTYRGIRRHDVGRRS